MAVAVMLFGLMAILAALQYHWLGQISEAEREQMRSSLTTGASQFASDFDREIARAFVLFQPEGPEVIEAVGPTDRFAARYDQWQATARFPKLIKDFYFVNQDGERLRLQRFDATQRALVAAEWPATMSDWRERLEGPRVTTRDDTNALFIRRLPPAIWETVPALIVPTPLFLVAAEATPGHGPVPSLLYSVLTLDLDYISKELLPSLTDQHFSAAGANSGYRIAVISRDDNGRPVFQSTAAFAPTLETRADAAADLFQLRPQDFTALNAEVRRYATFTTTKSEGAREAPKHRITVGGASPLSLVLQSRADGPGRSVVDLDARQRGVAGVVTTTTRLGAPPIVAHWKLVVAHPLGSLEAAVASQRRTNLAISTSVLGLLAASMGLLVLSTRRAQRLAKQQMEFVAAVSHELRTPLAIIRSAADNLADGVVEDEEGIRRYGRLMSAEGRRLTEMVEQILELAGIQSGQRGFALRSVPVAPLLRDIVSASMPLVEQAGLTIDVDAPDDLPPMLGEEAALRRVFQNLLDNAIKYGAGGGWIRITACKAGADVSVTVADGGIGIDPADQPRIFEPFYRAPSVVDAQMQGAGLGLSLVQRIVAAHGGRITVKSAPRAGSEFTVHLPVVGGHHNPVSVLAEEAPRGVEAPRYS